MSGIKKFFVIVIFVAFIAGAGYAIYRVFFKPAATEPAAPTETNVNTPAGTLSPSTPGVNIPVVPSGPGTNALFPASPVARGGATVSPTLFNGPTLGAKLASDGKTVRFYDRATGKFMSITADGTLVELSDTVFPAAKNIVWSGNSEKAVIEFPDGTKLIYDFATKKQSSIPRSWEDFSFSPASDKLAAKQESENIASRYLIVSKADGTEAVPVEPLGENGDKVTVAWSPSGDVLALSETGDTDMAAQFGEKQVLFIGANGENFPATVVDGFDFIPLWSPDGRYLLYSASGTDDDFRPRLYVVTGSGDNRGSGRRAINLITFADKCSFGGATTAYCAVPDYLPEGTGLERTVAKGIPDSIYRINVVTGAITLVGRPETDTTISSLSVSTDGGTLFFTDEETGAIKKMSLK
jgi:WD40 repeat protein